MYTIIIRLQALSIPVQISMTHALIRKQEPALLQNSDAVHSLGKQFSAHTLPKRIGLLRFFRDRMQVHRFLLAHGQVRDSYYQEKLRGPWSQQPYIRQRRFVSLIRLKQKLLLHSDSGNSLRGTKEAAGLRRKLENYSFNEWKLTIARRFRSPVYVTQMFILVYDFNTFLLIELSQNKIATNVSQSRCLAVSTVILGTQSYLHAKLLTPAFNAFVLKHLSSSDDAAKHC